jgi:virginiamycin A acetyltransferase
MRTRKVLKRTIKHTFLLLLVPVYLLYELLCMFANRDSTFQSFSQAISLIPGKLGIYTRAAFYRLACPDTSDEVSIGFLSVFSHSDTTIGRGVYIGPQCNLGKCTIGANTLLGSGVHILSGKNQHNFSEHDKPIQEQGGSFEKITIGEDCWLGNCAIIMADLPNHSIVAAGGVYVTDVGQPWTIMGGNPAITIKIRHKESPTP